MATWEDGPEYAPLERPDGFADPDVAPLKTVPAEVQQAALAPKERPQFADPPDAVAPLESLIPPVETPRDPQQPFEVVASTVTAESSAWSAAHWSPPAPTSVGPGQWPAPNGTPWPATPASTWAPAVPPTQPIGQPGPSTAYGPFAPPYPPPAPTQPTVDVKQLIQAATPGVLLPLVVGGLLYPLAPILMAVAFGLSTRVTVGRQQVRTALGVLLGILGFYAGLNLLFGGGSASDWWQDTAIAAMVGCWGLLILVLLLVYRELRSGRRPQPRRSSWG